MINPLATNASKSLGMLIARVMLGGVLVYAGYLKVFDMGVSNFVEASASRVPSFMPEWFGPLYLRAVPFAELILGSMIVLGLLTRLSAFLSAAMLASFGLAFGLNNSSSLGNADAANWRDLMAGFINTEAALASQVPQDPLIFGALALIILFVGAGSLSVDRMLFGKPNA